LERKIVVFTTSITCCWLPQWFGLESAHLFMSIDIDCWYITWLVDVLFESISLSIGLFVLDCFFICVNYCVQPVCFFKLQLTHHTFILTRRNIIQRWVLRYLNFPTTKQCGCIQRFWVSILLKDGGTLLASPRALCMSLGYVCVYLNPFCSKKETKNHWLVS